MRLAIGSDHAGYTLKEAIKKHLKEKSFEYIDYGTDSEQSVDYPLYAQKVAEAVVAKEADLGIIVCGTGIGVSIAANKVPGIRAAVCSDCFSAEACRQHNNANIITLGSRVVGEGLAIKIIDTFLNSKYEAGRHQKRIDLIEAIEKKYMHSTDLK